MASRVIGARQTVANFRGAARLLAAPLNGASKRALEPTADRAKALAPVPTLRKTIRIQRVRGSPRTRPRYVLGFTGIGRRIAHLIEFGTAPHSLAKGASRRRGILQDIAPFSPGTPARPFMRSAWETTKGSVGEIFGREFWPAWERNLQRLAARAAKRARR